MCKLAGAVGQSRACTHEVSGRSQPMSANMTKPATKNLKGPSQASLGRFWPAGTPQVRSGGSVTCGPWWSWEE